MCVLLVEDESLIREIMAFELDEHGFEVCEAETGDEAVELIKNPPKPFSLLITDIHMPGRTDGIEVARLMRMQHPTLPIIYTTGRPDMMTALEPLGSNEAFVAKPYTPTEVMDVVHRLLSVHPPPSKELGSGTGPDLWPTDTRSDTFASMEIDELREMARV